MARKPRRGKQLQRKVPKRKPYDRVLIVCEGEKTEPIYFEDLCDVVKQILPTQLSYFL